MCRQPSPTPGPVCIQATFSQTITRLSRGNKLRAAIMRAMQHLSPELGGKLQSLRTPGAIGIIAATAAVWVAGHFFGLSEIVDVALVGIGALALGAEAVTACQELAAFVTTALEAK